MQRYQYQIQPSMPEFIDLENLKVVAKSRNQTGFSAFTVYQWAYRDYIRIGNFSEADSTETSNNWEILSELDFMRYLVTGTVTMM